MQGDGENCDHRWSGEFSRLVGIECGVLPQSGGVGPMRQVRRAGVSAFSGGGRVGKVLRAR